MHFLPTEYDIKIDQNFTFLKNLLEVAIIFKIYQKNTRNIHIFIYLKNSKHGINYEISGKVRTCFFRVQPVCNFR